MPLTLTFIGLGQTGTSLGLALQPYASHLRRVGHDREPSKAQWAQKLGAVDAVQFNLHDAASQADLLILALPQQEMLPALQEIAPDLRPSALVLETAPLKRSLHQQAAAILPPGVSLVGLLPVPAAEFLNNVSSAPDALRFAHSALGIVAPRNITADCLKRVTDLAELLQMEPYFLEPEEADSLMTSTYLLPQVLAALLLEQTADRPGWQEGRRLAEIPYAQAVSALIDSPETLNALLQAAAQPLSRLLNEAQARLQRLNNSLAAGETSAAENLSWLENSQRSRQRWLEERSQGSWQAVEHQTLAPPPPPSRFGGWFKKK